MMLVNKWKHTFVGVFLICLLNKFASCHTQEAVTTAPATQTHWQRPAHVTRNTVSRWKTVGSVYNFCNNYFTQSH